MIEENGDWNQYFIKIWLISNNLIFILYNQFKEKETEIKNNNILILIDIELSKKYLRTDKRIKRIKFEQ